MIFFYRNEEVNITEKNESNLSIDREATNNTDKLNSDVYIHSRHGKNEEITVH